MNPENLPFVGPVFRFGARDRVLDSHLLLGPIVILTYVISGRNTLTVLITGVYVLSFIVYVLYNGRWG